MDEMNGLERQLADVVRGAMRPPRPVDAAAIVRTATANAPRGRSALVGRFRDHPPQAPAAKGFTMFSALKYAAASVILALFGGFLLMSVLSAPQEDDIAPATESHSLAPTGMEIVSPSTGATEMLVADGEGALWAFERPGRLVRFDPDTDTTTEWTLADDLAFARANSITPSAGGGIWLAGPDAARLFDGDHFTQVIESPDVLTLTVEADDGSLWAATESGAVLHWDGSDWQDVGPASPTDCDWIRAMVVDSTGRPWVVGQRYSSCGGSGGAGVIVLEGSEWTRFDMSDASPLTKWPTAIAEMPDGSIWVASEGGLARFDGSTWTVVTPAGGHPYSTLAATPDGSVWTHSDNRTNRVWRWDGAAWTKLDGPTGPTEDHWSADLATVGERVFLGTPEGTYERIGDGWEPAWDVAPASVSSPRLLATGDDELWVVDTRAVRHIQDGVVTDELEWTTHVADSGLDASFGRDLTLGPDGTVWVAGPDGVAFRDGDRWELIDERKAAAVAVDAAGTVWAARPIQSGGCRMWTLREKDGAWVRKDIDGCPLQYPAELSLEVDGDGAVWLGGTGFWMPGGLARYADGEWETIDAIGDAEVFGAVVIGTAGHGAVWVVSQENLGSREHHTRSHAGRWHGSTATTSRSSNSPRPRATSR